MAIITWKPKLYTAIEFISTFLQIYYYYLRNIFPKKMELQIILLLISETFWKSIYLICSTRSHQDHSPFAEQQIAQLGLSNTCLICKVYFKTLSCLCPPILNYYISECAQSLSGPVYSHPYGNTCLKPSINSTHISSRASCIQVITKTCQSNGLPCLMNRSFWWPVWGLTRTQFISCKEKIYVLLFYSFNSKIKTKES